MNDYQRMLEVPENQPKERIGGTASTRYFSAVEVDDIGALKTRNTQQSAVEASQLNLLITSSSVEDNRRMRH